MVFQNQLLKVKESLKNYENELSDTRLEFEYLSSTEKLLQYQTQFFEKDLNQKNINKIKIITKKLNNLSIDNSNIFKTNEKK